MQYITVSDGCFEKIDFVPTIIVGFYKETKASFFQNSYHKLKSIYPDVEVIGCSSAGNIADEIPYVEADKEFPIVYFCCDMKKEAFTTCLIEEGEEITADKIGEQMVLLSSFPSPYLEKILADFSQLDPVPKVYGAVAGGEAGLNTKTSVFYNGTYYMQHMILWCIDQRCYSLDGMSIHLFRPAGIPLEITKSEGKKILELNNFPALDVLEEITGRIDESVVSRFGYPLFLQKQHASMHWSSTPLASIVAIHREEKTLEMYRDIYTKEYVRIGIMLSRRDQLRRLGRLYETVPKQGAALLFHCIGIRENLKMMEYLYLEEIKHHIDVTFAGFHTFGEIGFPASRQASETILLHNQTMTIVVISEKDEACS